MKKNCILLYVVFLAVTSAFAQIPYAHYPLDGHPQDVSGNNRHGTIIGTQTPTVNRFNETSQALLFNGSTYIDLPEDFDFSQRTMIVWFKVTGLPPGNGNLIFGTDHPGMSNGLYGLHVKDIGGLPYLRMVSDTIAHQELAIYDKWYQTAIVRTPGWVKLYVDGVLVRYDVNPVGYTSSNGVTHGHIGCDRNHSGLTIGTIDDLLIYNTALSDTDIANSFYSRNDSLATITGKLYQDDNQNQMFDAGEQPLPNQLVNIGSSNLAISNATGDYIAYVPTGSYTLTPSLSGTISWFTFNPSAITVNANNSGTTYSGNDFGVIVPPDFCSATLSAVAWSPPPRPGRNNRVSVFFTNVTSDLAINETIYFFYEPGQVFLGAVPSPTSIDTVTRTISWNLAGIVSGDVVQMRVEFYTPPTLPLGTIITYNTWADGTWCSVAELLIAKAQSRVVGSFDPNDKTVSPIGEAPGGRILPNTTLNYTIRFQNTGTYMAEDVRITDMLSPHLNLTTLKVLASSHAYEVLINGREITFRFPHINLPDSNSNEPLSHGFIQYSIEPAASFVQNTVVENFADIYFDFNEPVRTNTTQNTADNSVGISKTPVDGFAFKVYPNPLSSGSWQLITDESMTGKEVKIFDAAGRNIYSSRITNRQSEIDASHFAQGVYLLKIETSVAKIIKL